ncbi:MAG: ribonuclease III [Fibrobacter sp.]|nr:ribonuclease III [Fibrobacter sp.]
MNTKALKQKKNVIKRIFRFWFRRKSGNGLEAKLNYIFKDPALLARALVHRSWTAGKDMPYWENNERLEFLGDSILNMLVTEYLFKTYPQFSEGELSKRKGAIVSGKALAKSAQALELGTYLRIGKGEVRNGGRNRESLLADTFEAVLGALYLDAGLEECRTFLSKNHFPHIDEILTKKEFVNHKSALLEYMQSKGLPPPKYHLVEESGPEHLKVFKIEVLLEDNVRGSGKGISKKQAEQEAARIALESLFGPEENE